MAQAPWSGCPGRARPVPGGRAPVIIGSTRGAKAKLSFLLAKVEGGDEEVVICRNGKPVAMLVAVAGRPGDPMREDPRLGPVVFRENPCAPLDEDAWPKERL